MGYQTLFESALPRPLQSDELLGTGLSADSEKNHQGIRSAPSQAENAAWAKMRVAKLMRTAGAEGKDPIPFPSSGGGEFLIKWHQPHWSTLGACPAESSLPTLTLTTISNPFFSFLPFCSRLPSPDRSPPTSNAYDSH